MGAPIDSTIEGIQNSGSQAQITAIQDSLAAGATGETDPTKITFSNLDELKTKYPDIYNAFMLAWASQIQIDMQRHSDEALERMKEASAEAKRN